MIPCGSKPLSCVSCRFSSLPQGVAFFTMSVKIMSDVFEKSKTEGNTRLVLLCLADCANDEGACWPSIRKIAQKANLSEPMTKKHLNALIAIGVVNREEREDQSGRQTSNFYTVDVTKIGEDEIKRDVWEQVTPISRQHKFWGVTKVTGGGGNSSQGGVGVTEGSLSYMNHHKEPKKEPSEESSAKASHSSAEDLSEQQLFPKCADARSGKSDDLNSRPPHSGKKPIKRDSRKSPPTEIPSDLDCPAFREVWNDFLTHRKEKKKAVTPTNERALLKKLRSWGTSKAVDALQNSVTNGWLGVFPPKEEEWKPTTI